MNPEIFKAYDIRGVYPDDLSEDDAWKIGQATARFLPRLSGVWRCLVDILHGIPRLHARQEQVHTAEMLLQCGKTAVDLCEAAGVPARDQEQIARCYIRASLREIDGARDELRGAPAAGALGFTISEHSGPSAD